MQISDEEGKQHIENSAELDQTESLTEFLTEVSDISP